METDELLKCMKDGTPYKVTKSLLAMQGKCCRRVHLMNRLNSIAIKNALCKNIFGAFGEGNVIKTGFMCNYGFNIFIGNNCYFNYNLTILDSFHVNIGNNVFIAPNVVISPVTHPLEKDMRRNLIGGTIVIEDNVWIGAGSVILPGCTIKEGTVIGANSVVKCDTQENSVWGGCPARFIKQI